VNVVFLGYVRQIKQIDSTLKQIFLGAAGFGVEPIKLTAVQEIRLYLGRRWVGLSLPLYQRALSKMDALLSWMRL
jgi:hypothetical protein